MILRIIFPVVWISVLLLFYFLTHDQIINSLFKSNHYDFILVSFAVYVFVVYLIKEKRILFFTTGAGLIAVFFGFTFLSQFFLIIKLKIFSETNFLKLIITDISFFASIIFIFFSSLLLGKKILPDFSTIIQTGFGIIIQTFGLFFLGQFGILDRFFVFVLFLIPYLISIKEFLPFTNSLFFKPTSGISKIDYRGWASLFIILIFSVLNLVESIKPFPKGYDALTFYFNQIHQMYDNQELIYGYGPVNWLLYAGSGLILFGKNYFSFGLFSVTSIFSFFVFYDINRRFLSVNVALLGVALLASMPLFNSVAVLQQKVEGGLIFFGLLTFIIFLKYWDTKKGIHLFLLSFFLGFMFGIKPTSIILFLAFAMVIFAIELDKKIIISSFLLAIFTILFFRLDSFSGMREYHGNISLVMTMSFVVGVSLFLKVFFSQKREYSIFFSKVGILISGFLIPILPYLFYNISNTDEISLKTLIFQNPTDDKIKFEELKILIENERND